MTNEELILVELQKINKNLTSKNSFKIALNSFLAGFLHSLGYFVGTIIIFWLLLIFAKQFDLAKNLSRTFENFMSQIRWEKVIPTPKIEIFP